MAMNTPLEVPKQSKNEDAKAQAQVWKHMYGFAETIMLRCTITLGIPDLVHNHGPITLAQLAAQLPVKSISTDRLSRFMRYLVHMNLFKTSVDHISKQTTYELTPASKLLVKSHEKSLAPYVLLQTHPEEFSIWGHMIDYLDGKKAYWELTYGISMYEKIGKDPEIYNELVNDALTSHSRFMAPALMSGLLKENIFDTVGSMVDVGGNSGVAAKAIANAFPHMKCTVMDLIHVIETVVKDTELEYVAGDMFNSIPRADAVFIKSTLHNYDDDSCLKILTNAKEAIPSIGGKVILVEIVVDIEDMPEFSSARLSMEMEMMLMGGKERTKQEWDDLLHKAGFSYHKIIPIMAIESVIVGYP